MNKEALAQKLAEVGAIKFGNFTFASGIQSPIYVDFRILISFPDVLECVSDIMWQEIQKCSFDYLCGVPVGALPLATSIAVHNKVPMIMLRPAKKDHGTRKMIEGTFSAGDTALVVEDVITSGTSACNSIKVLDKEGIVVTDVVAILDYKRGGHTLLGQNGCALHALYTISELVEYLFKSGVINADQSKQVNTFIKQHQV